jgi:hypothetical protein
MSPLKCVMHLSSAGSMICRCPIQPPSLIFLVSCPLNLSLHLARGRSLWDYDVSPAKLNPQPTDPTQAKVMAFLPFVFTFVCANFPSGLVIYWCWGNILSILQQWAITRKYKPRLTKETLSHIKAPKNGKK